MNIKSLLLRSLSTTIFLVINHSETAQAFMVYESVPGTIEVRGAHDQGLVVTRVQTRKLPVAKKNHQLTKNKEWLYFCVSEVFGKKVSERTEKCFYGDPKLFKNVRDGVVFSSIEYGLKQRIFNEQSNIAIGAKRYFYPAYVVYELK